MPSECVSMMPVKVPSNPRWSFHPVSIPWWSVRWLRGRHRNARFWLAGNPQSGKITWYKLKQCQFHPQINEIMRDPIKARRCPLPGLLTSHWAEMSQISGLRSQNLDAAKYSIPIGWEMVRQPNAHWDSHNVCNKPETRARVEGQASLLRTLRALENWSEQPQWLQRYSIRKKSEIMIHRIHHKRNRVIKHLLMWVLRVQPSPRLYDNFLEALLRTTMSYGFTCTLSRGWSMSPSL